ncbi:hypothetical protein Fmac_012187 [Flemingia macrophylla]|uniref:Uncharacterized protein n=1 Tax=Flemingia macrophylla TaxID=520843 RepID=A0ABD1MPY9_9FABA
MEMAMVMRNDNHGERKNANDGGDKWRWIGGKQKTMDLSECLKKEEVVVHEKILQLEKNLDPALQWEEEMMVEIAALLKEKT